MKILSHRGIFEENKSFPNSLAALYDAIKGGFSLETDLRFSKDKRIVISHDADMKGTLDMRDFIKDINYLDLQKNNQNVFERIPELSILLKHIKQLDISDCILAWHVKDFGNRELLYSASELIKNFGLEKNSFLFDLLLKDLKDIKEKFPDIKTSVSVGEKNYSPTIYTKDDIVEYLEYIDIIWADEWQSNLYNKEFFQHYKELGKEIYVISPELHKAEKHPYAENPKELWEKIATFPFDGICTDFPREADHLFNRK